MSLHQLCVIDPPQGPYYSKIFHDWSNFRKEVGYYLIFLVLVEPKASFLYHFLKFARNLMILVWKIIKQL